MWEDEDCSLFPAKSSDDWDSGGISRTFKHSLGATGPLSLIDLDMWDTKSRFKSQSSAWCGMTSVSGSGFLSKVSTSTSGSNDGFRQSDTSRRRWQSMSRLAPEGAPRTSPGAELRAALEGSGFRRAELVQRLREAHQRLDSQTDLSKAGDTQLHHSVTTAQLLDMKHKQLAEEVSALEQEKEAAEVSRFEENRHRGELQDKILQLEMDMLKMRLTLERGSVVQPASIQRTSNPLSRTLPVTQDDFYREEKQKAERELCKLREVLRETEERAETLAAERDHALQQFHSSKEAQRTLLSQMEEMNQRLSCTMQAHSEVQEQLSDARSNQGQASLEKDLLTTKVLRLEDSIQDLKAKLSAALSDKDCLIEQKADLHQRVQGLELQLDRAQQGREGFTNQVYALHEQLAEAKAQNNRQDQETVLMKQELISVREVNEKLTGELAMAKQRLETSQTQLHELTEERVIHTNRITALETERSQLIGEKKELLSKLNEGGQVELTELRARCHQLRESQELLQGENQKLQDYCLCLEADVLEKEEELHLEVEEHHRTEAERAQNMEELRAVASHWTEKWQDVALTLHSTQGKLEELKLRDPGNKLQEEATRLETEVEGLQKERQKDKEEMECLLRQKTNVETELHRVKMESDSLLRVELDVCKQDLELERSKSQASLHRCKGEGKGNEAVQTLDKETVTELSMPPQISAPSWLKPSESDSSQNYFTQEADGEIGQVKAELQKGKRKASGNSQDDGDHTDVLTTESLRAQQEESIRRTSQLQQEKDQAVQRLQTLRLLHQVKAEKPSPDSKKGKTVCLDNQRRMVAEQLKGLFKEREELGKVCDISSEAQSSGSSLQEWERKPKVIKNAVDTLQSQRRRQQELRDRSCQQGAGLSSVTEEQEEEDPDWPAGEEGEQEEEDPDRPAGEEGEQEEEEARLREELSNKSDQMSAMNVEISNLKERNENLLQGEAKLRFQQQMQSLRATAPQLHAKKSSERSSDTRVPRLSDSTSGGNLQRRLSPLYRDGIFLARLVEICSPDEEEEEEDKRGTT